MDLLVERRYSVHIRVRGTGARNIGERMLLARGLAFEMRDWLWKHGIDVALVASCDVRSYTLQSRMATPDGDLPLVYLKIIYDPVNREDDLEILINTNSQKDTTRIGRAVERVLKRIDKWRREK